MDYINILYRPKACERKKAHKKKTKKLHAIPLTYSLDSLHLIAADRPNLINNPVLLSLTLECVLQLFSWDDVVLSLDESI